MAIGLFDDVGHVEALALDVHQHYCAKFFLDNDEVFLLQFHLLILTKKMTALKITTLTMTKMVANREGHVVATLNFFEPEQQLVQQLEHSADVDVSNGLLNQLVPMLTADQMVLD